MQPAKVQKNNIYVRATIALSLVLLFITVSIPTWYVLAFARHETVIGHGVQLPGLPLGGMNKDEAVAAIRAWEGQRTTHRLQVRLDPQLWTLTPATVKWRIDAESIVTEALSVGRRGSWATRWNERWQSVRHGYMLSAQSASSRRNTVSWLRQLEAAVYEAPHNAYRDVKNGVVVKEKIGRQLDIEASANAVELALAHLDAQVDLVVQPLPPQVTYTDAANVDVSVTLASFSTTFNAAMQSRVANIRLASTLINGTILHPGEVFSFNQIVGPREKGTGFQEAPELLKGDLVTGIGGGICQVSSTLYNAVLFSNLTVLERYKHSTVLGYVPAGRDATVSYDQLDFRFRNTLDYPIVLRSSVVKNQITVELRGQKALPYKVNLVSEVRRLPFAIVEQVDTNLAPGKRVITKEGKAGQLVTIRKEVRHAGKPASSPVVVSKNFYEAAPQVVRVGPAVAKKEGVARKERDTEQRNTAVSATSPNTIVTGAATPVDSSESATTMLMVDVPVAQTAPQQQPPAPTTPVAAVELTPGGE